VNEQSNERGCFGMMIGLLLIWIIIALVTDFSGVKLSTFGSRLY
jgi:hypothetical protein